MSDTIIVRAHTRAGRPVRSYTRGNTYRKSTSPYADSKIYGKKGVILKSTDDDTYVITTGQHTSGSFKALTLFSKSKPEGNFNDTYYKGKSVWKKVKADNVLNITTEKRKEYYKNKISERKRINRMNADISNIFHNRKNKKKNAIRKDT